MFILVEVWSCISPSLLPKCSLKKMGRPKDNIRILSVSHLQGKCFCTVINIIFNKESKAQPYIKPV